MEAPITHGHVLHCTRAYVLMIHCINLPFSRCSSFFILLYNFLLIAITNGNRTQTHTKKGISSILGNIMFLFSQMNAGSNFFCYTQQVGLVADKVFSRKQLLTYSLNWGYDQCTLSNKINVTAHFVCSKTDSYINVCMAYVRLSEDVFALHNIFIRGNCIKVCNHSVPCLPRINTLERTKTNLTSWKKLCGFPFDRSYIIQHFISLWKSSA